MRCLHKLGFSIILQSRPAPGMPIHPQSKSPPALKSNRDLFNFIQIWISSTKLGEEIRFWAPRLASLDPTHNMKPIRVLGNKNLGIWTINLVAYGRLTYLFVQASVFGFHYPTLYLHYTEDLHNFLCYSHWMGHLPRNIYPTKIVRTAVWITLYFICVTKSLYASGTKIQPLHSCRDYSGVKVAFLVFPHSRLTVVQAQGQLRSQLKIQDLSWTIISGHYVLCAHYFYSRTS